ncbi:MAG: hypothetical protein P4L83_12760 [Nevskia sp.]|nr:hypothetical protein [Nevskia sp.]
MIAAEKYGASAINYGLVPERSLLTQKRVDEGRLSGNQRFIYTATGEHAPSSRRSLATGLGKV